MTLLSVDEAEPIRSAIIRKEAWTQDSVRRLRADAEHRIREGPWSVTFDRPKRPGLDAHDYYSEAPDWWPNPIDPTAPYMRQEGKNNPERYMEHRNALNAMCDTVFTLGAAAYLLDEPRYAARAARIVNVWFINPNTRMNPDLDHAQVIRGIDEGRASGVIDGRFFIRAIQGMDFLEQTGTWNPKERAAVARWFQEYLHWLTHSKNGLDEKESGNSHASWWVAQAAAVASFVGDADAANAAFSFYRDSVLPRQIRRDGSAPREETGARSLWYSAFNLEALALVCQIAGERGVNLWQTRSREGATLSSVVDYLAPYLADPRRWRKDLPADVAEESYSALAFAGMGLKRGDYLDLFFKLAQAQGAWLSLVDLMAGRWEAANHQTRH